MSGLEVCISYVRVLSATGASLYPLNFFPIFHNVDRWLDTLAHAMTYEKCSASPADLTCFIHVR